MNYKYNWSASLIPGRCQLQVLGSLPNLWSRLKSLSFLQKGVFGQFISHILVNRDTPGPWFQPHVSLFQADTCRVGLRHIITIIAFSCRGNGALMQGGVTGPRGAGAGIPQLSLVKGRLLSKQPRESVSGPPLRVRRFETYSSQMCATLETFLHNA